MGKRYDKIYTYIGPTTSTLRLTLTAVDMGAGSHFTRQRELDTGSLSLLR